MSVVCDTGELDRIQPIRLLTYVFDKPRQASQFYKGSSSGLGTHRVAPQAKTNNFFGSKIILSFIVFGPLRSQSRAN